MFKNLMWKFGTGFLAAYGVIYIALLFARRLFPNVIEETAKYWMLAVFMICAANVLVGCRYLKAAAAVLGWDLAAIFLGVYVLIFGMLNEIYWSGNWSSYLCTVFFLTFPVSISASLILVRDKLRDRPGESIESVAGTSG